MPDPSLSAAIQEAYASAPSDQVIHHTLEIWHPSFAVPIRVVRDFVPLDARIEAGAARDAGLIVTFVGYAFDMTPPDQTHSGLPQAVIEIDNVSREIGTQIDLAVIAGEPITVIYRAFLSGLATVGPENIPPLEMTLISVTLTPMRIRCVAGFANLLDVRFPRREYDLERFPALAQ